MTTDRRQDAYAVRLEAAELARSRDHATHQANGDEQRYAGDQYFMSFTKGLPHNPDTGLLGDAGDFVAFRKAIDEGFIDPFSISVRHGALFTVSGNSVSPVNPIPADLDLRQWEAPTAGVTFDLQGPDAQAVTMPPAPPLLNSSGQANPELIFEMAEVYELAILRDQPFNDFEDSASNSTIDDAICRLNNLDYIGSNDSGRPRKLNSANELGKQTVFRGSSPGVEVGPYLSQFLLIGNVDRNNQGSIAEGKISYGVLQIDQKVPVAEPCKDYMVTMADYVEVQRGIDPGPTAYVPAIPGDATARPARRFISTPRDLATYVHHDALYEAYLNACIILLEMKTPFDPAFDHLSGMGASNFTPLASTAVGQSIKRNAGGFALYGGPHILNLVTEVATRALKAVRFQKFNNHIRLRPEALAARIELTRLAQDPAWAAGKTIPANLLNQVGQYANALWQNAPAGGGDSTLAAIAKLTQKNGAMKGNYLLPMAFAEGSPMHPAYGAGHATVAGACVTILKAFFDTSTVLAKTKNKQGQDEVKFKRAIAGDQAIAFRAPNLPGPNPGQGAPTTDLVSSTPDQFLTLEGELNKLAANISIGRNMAGVHYFSDYYDSLRMGEQIALGILEEQALTYSTDPFVLSVPTFDGNVVRIGHQ